MGERAPRAPHEGISKKVKRFTVRKTSQQRCLAGVSQMTIGAFTTVFCVIPAPPRRSVLFWETFLTVLSFIFLICKVRITVANLTEIQ